MTLLKLEFKSILRGLLIWSGILVIILILFMAFFPSMESSAMQELVGIKLDATQAPLLEVFGLSEMSDFTDIIVYFGYVMQYINIAVAIYGALLGASALIKEESEGTIEYLYAQPITRNGIVAGKMVADLLAVCLLMILLGTVSMVLILVFSSGKQDIIRMLLEVIQIYVGTFMIGFIYIAIGFLFSVKLSNAKQIGSAAMGVVFGTYIIGVFASLADAVNILRYLSPIDCFEPYIIVKSGIDFKALTLWGGVAIIIMVMTFVFYNKKDFRIT